jgi:hypothetical protein
MPAAWWVFSAFMRVMEAISSIDAEVCSSDAACSVAPCDSDCDALATCDEAVATCCAPCARSCVAVRSVVMMPFTTHRTTTASAIDAAKTPMMSHNSRR